jgi:hypothetical protein
MSDLNIRARGLLNFVEQSVTEGQRDPSTALECYREADHALGILRKTLDREDQHCLTKLSLTGVFNNSFVLLAEQGADPKEALEQVAFAKTQFP